MPHRVIGLLPQAPCNARPDEGRGSLRACFVCARGPVAQPKPLPGFPSDPPAAFSDSSIPKPRSSSRGNPRRGTVCRQRPCDRPNGAGLRDLHRSFGTPRGRPPSIYDDIAQSSDPAVLQVVRQGVRGLITTPSDGSELSLLGRRIGVDGVAHDAEGLHPRLAGDGSTTSPVAGRAPWSSACLIRRAMSSS